MIDLSGFISDLLDADVFAENATFTPAGGQGRSVVVIYDNGYQAAQYRVAEAEIESLGPKVTCREADVVDVAHGDTIVLRGVTLHVLEVQPDGFGMVTILLSKDPLP